MNQKDVNESDYEKTSRYVFENYANVTYEIENDSHLNKKELFIKIGQERFDPITFLNYYVNGSWLKIKNEKEDTKILIQAAAAKAIVLSFIDIFEYHTKDLKPKPQYDYSSIINRATAAIEGIKIEVEVFLLNNQIETNKISKITNSYIAIFTACAGGWYLYDLVYRIASEDTITRHLNKLTPHYKNVKFLICFLITAISIWLIYARLQKVQSNQKQKEETNKKETT